MKKTLRILTIVFAVAVAIASCSKEPQLVGKWKLTKLNIENQQIAAMLMGYTQQAIGQEFEFKADGTVAVDGAVSENVEGQMRYVADGTNIDFILDVDMTVDTIAIDTTITVSGTYELPDETALKMKLGLPLPENQMNLRELKFSIEAERQ